MKCRSTSSRHFDSARKVCGSAKVGRKGLKKDWWDDKVKDVVARKKVI